MSARPPAHARPVSNLEVGPEVEHHGRPFLVYSDSDGGRQLFFFAPDAADASVGRVPPADLLLDWDAQVSRLHARFERAGDDWEIADDGLSSNGTFLNGQRVNGRRRLQDGDTLLFGATTVIFHSPGREQPGAREPSQTRATVSLSSTQRRVLLALCRPYKTERTFARPASDQQIAEELFLSAGSVRTHLEVLYAKLGVEQLAESDMRVGLVERAFSAGLISERDL